MENRIGTIESEPLPLVGVDQLDPAQMPPVMMATIQYRVLHKLGLFSCQWCREAGLSDLDMNAWAFL